MYPHQNGWGLFAEGYPAAGGSSSSEAPPPTENTATPFTQWTPYDSSSTAPTYSTPTNASCLKPGSPPKPHEYIATAATSDQAYCYHHLDQTTQQSATPPPSAATKPETPNTVEAFHRVPLGEKGRMELKAAIRAAIKDKPELRERVNDIAKLRCATIPQLLKIALICNLWTKALDISRRFVESRNGKQARQGARRQASPKAAPENRSRLTPRDRVMKTTQVVVKRPSPQTTVPEVGAAPDWIPPPAETPYVAAPAASSWGTSQYYDTTPTPYDTSQDALSQSAGLFGSQSDHFVAPEYDTLWSTAGPFVRDSIL